MQLTVRVDKHFPNPDAARVFEGRARFALTRLAPALDTVSVFVWVETLRDGGRAGCRVAATFHNGRTLHIYACESDPRTSLDKALDRFRRAAHRMMNRDRVPERRGPRSVPDPARYAV